MAEYIEREAVKSKAVYMHGFGKNKYVPLRVIEEAPAADVAPVVHGRWKEWAVQWRECSACRYRIQYSYAKDCNFCPNCGAKMDLEGGGGA